MANQCPICQKPLPARKPGPGRPKTYCGPACRLEAQRRIYRAEVDAAEQVRREEYRAFRESLERAWKAYQDRIAKLRGNR